MPAYVYKCKECQETYKVVHSMTESLHDCEHCNGVKTLERIPSLLTSYDKHKTEKDFAGERVARAIEDNRKILLDQKDVLRNKDYKP